MDIAPCGITCITGVISNTVTIIHGRNDSTLRDHPVFSRNITQAHKTRGSLRPSGSHAIRSAGWQARRGWPRVLRHACFFFAARRRTSGALIGEHCLVIATFTSPDGKSLATFGKRNLGTTYKL